MHGLIGNGLKIDGSNSMQGNLNVGTNNILLGNTTGLFYLSAICIRQTGRLTALGPQSGYGLKFFNSTSMDGYYMGYTDSDNFGIFKQNNDLTCQLIMSINVSGITMNNNGINGLSLPVNISDAATKGYVDDSLTNTLKIDGTNSMQANLNVGLNNLLVGDFSGGVTNLSSICIKQAGQISNTAASSIFGLKFYNSTTNDGYYMGYTIDGYLGIFNQTNAATYQKLVDIGNDSIYLYKSLTMSGNRITGLSLPISYNDAATKGYVDTLSSNSSSGWRFIINISKCFINTIRSIS